MATNPSIANENRVVDYSPVTATTDFVIDWPVYVSDGEDPEDDLVVLIDGEALDSDDYTFSGTEIEDLAGVYNGGTVTLDTAVNGDRVIIYSKRDPRRIGYFLEGKRLPMTELDKVLNDYAAQLRDMDLRLKRAVLVNMPDYLDGSVIPEDLGEQVTADANRAEAAAELVEGVVQSAIQLGALYGIQTGGVVDQTANIQAFTAAFPTGGYLKFPPGVIRISGRSVLGSWSNVNGLILDFTGVTFEYDPLDAVPSVGTVWNMFSFTNCTDVTRIGTLTVNGILTAALVKASSSIRGARVSYFYGACKHIRLGPLVINGVCMGDQFDDRPILKIASLAYIGSAGAGYTNGDSVTIVGGSGSTAATGTLIVGGGIVTGITIVSGGLYPFNGDVSSLPTVGATDTGAAITGGTGTGLKMNFNIALSDPDDQHDDIILTSTYATNCCYGGQINYGGRNIDLGSVYCDHVYRAWAGFGGVEHVRGTFFVGDGAADQIAMGAGYGLGGSDIALDIHLRPPVTANYSLNRSICRLNLNNNGYPSSWGIALNFDAVWGEVAGRGGSMFLISRDDSLGRGNNIYSLRLTGSVFGVGDQDSGAAAGNLFGQNISFSYPAGDSCSGIHIDINNRGAGVIHFTPAWLNAPISLNNTKSDAAIAFNDTATGTGYLTARAFVDVGNAQFTNRYGYDGTYLSTVGNIQRQADTTIPTSWSGYEIDGFTGTGAAVVYSLPAATVGLEYQFTNAHTTASSEIHLDPNGSEVIRGGGAGKKLRLESLGASAKLKCRVAGIWEILSSSGTTSFEP